MDLFVRGFSESFKIGDFVKVEADRGFDLGVIALILLPEVADYPYHSIPRRRVLSLANDDEKAFLLAKIEEEYRALDICRELAARRQMKINVLDAELQFDRRKLTFLFTSEKYALPPPPPLPASQPSLDHSLLSASLFRHTDFRELVRDLFSIFKTRIWMQKINPAQAASLEQDCKNSHFPTLPSMIHSFEALSTSSPYHFDHSPSPQSPNYTSPASSPSRTPSSLRLGDPPPPSLHPAPAQPPPLPPLHQQQHHHLSHRGNNNTARSSSFTSTGSYEEEDEEEAYQAERARRVGGIRGIRGEGDSLSYTFTGGAGSRAGVRGLNALNVHSHPHLLAQHHHGPPPLPPSHMRMAHSLPHGLDSQSLYSGSGVGNQREYPLRVHSGVSERPAVYDLNGNNISSTLSLPAALPSHHWSSHQLYPSQPQSHSESPVTNTEVSLSTSSADNIYSRNLSHYAGIPISSRQLKTFELQQQRYLRDKYHTPGGGVGPGGGETGAEMGSESFDPSHATVDSILSHLGTVPEILDGIQINLSDLGEETTPPAYYSSPPPLPTNRTQLGGVRFSRSSNTPIDIAIATDPSYE
jgi:hypothetical protein